MPIRVIAAPPINIRWVGPQRVTSCPKRWCHMSSSGKPISEKAPQTQISTPPSGAHQSWPIRIATLLGRCRGRTIAMKPAVKIPKSPTRMK